MQYEPLTKVYYKNAAGYEEAYWARFNSSDALHLNFTINDFPAFIVENSEMYRLLLQIHKTDKQVEYLCRGLPNVALEQFAERCLIDEIVLSNDIEGVNSTRREIKEVLNQLETAPYKRRFYGIVRKYTLLRSGEERAIRTCQDVRDIYDELVLKEVVEEDPKDAPDGKYFRHGPVSVNTAAQKEIHRGLMPEARINDAMERALAFLNNDDVDPLVRTSAFHYLFGYIHPFYNGNGRLSRFISSYLMSNELNFLIAYRLSYTVKDNLKQYNDAFKICNDVKNKGDLTPFVISFLEILQEAMDQLEIALSKRIVEYRRFIDMIRRHHIANDPKYRSLFDLLIQAGLFSGSGISTRDLQTCLQMSYTPLRNRLEVLRGEHLLKEEKYGKEKFYKLDLENFERQVMEEE